MDPYVNTAIGVAYLAWLRDYYKGSPYRLLAAYNVGPGRMNELLSQRSFQPTETKKYFLSIRRGVPVFRFYQKRPNKV
jgi:soluble lytic murein transglycosylase-like protein